jgi:DNA-binding FrmR family transcriptional regulator
MDKKILSSLRIIEGQIRGIQKMIKEGRDCAEIITQLSAVKSAINSVGLAILTEALCQCARGKEEEAKIMDLANLIQQLFF